MIINDFKRSQKTQTGRLVLVSVIGVLYAATFLTPSLNRPNDFIFHSPALVLLVLIYTAYRYAFIPFTNE